MENVGLVKVVFLAIFCVSFSSATDITPVAIWGSNSVGELSPAAVGEVVSLETFQSDFVDKILEQSNGAVVFFLQDMLGIEDVTKFGDAYNVNGNGGSFKNLKKYLDDADSSRFLSAVDSPARAVTHLREKFSGRVEVVKSEDIANGIKPKEGVFYLVNLPETSLDSRGESLHENDKLIGQVVDALEKAGVRYTAFYTGVQSSRLNRVELLQHKIRVARQLLQTDDSVENKDQNDEVTPILINATCLLFYATQVKLQLIPAAENSTYVLPNDKAEKSSDCGNNTKNSIQLTYQNVGKIDKLVFKLTAVKSVKDYGWWTVSSATVAITGNLKANSSFSGKERNLIATSWTSPLSYSYHCSDDTLNQDRYQPSNVTFTNQVALKFEGLQMQFIMSDGTNNTGKFGPPNDCVGFFTIPIWMGIFTTLIVVTILSFGIFMLMSIKTMDRFDDPKGKTITVPATEG